MGGTPDTGGVVRFGEFELDVAAAELRRGTGVVRLQDQPFELLRAMLARPGDVVTREELRRRLWPDGTFVDFEHSLNAAVKRLRAALGDDAANPRFIETLPRRGYRFIAPLDHQAPARLGPTRRLASTRVAVLPFRDLGRDTHAYFADGLTEELIARVGVVCRDRVEVVARWSSMVFKHTTLRACEVGEALRADYLLEGSVRREGEQVRIASHLVHAATDTQLWSDTYDRHIRDVLQVQGDVAARIARSLLTELTPAGHARGNSCDPAAYQALLRGRYYWNKRGDEGLDQAIGFYEAAIAGAPDYGPAHAALARARLGQAIYYRAVPRDALAAARASAERALALDQGLYEAHITRADVRRLLDGDWQDAREGYQTALSLNPSFELGHRAYANWLSALGRHDEALAESARACDLDPLCLTVGWSAAAVAFAAEDYEAAVQYARNTLDIDPQFTHARRVLGAAYVMTGRADDGISQLERCLSPNDDDPVVLCWLAHAHGLAGHRDAGASYLARLPVGGRYVSPFHTAVAYAGLNRPADALASLEAAFEDRDPGLATLAVEPRLASLRTEPRFTSLLARLRIPG